MYWRRKWQPTPVFLPGPCVVWKGFPAFPAHLRIMIVSELSPLLQILMNARSYQDSARVETVLTLLVASSVSALKATTSARKPASVKVIQDLGYFCTRLAIYFLIKRISSIPA